MPDDRETLLHDTGHAHLIIRGFAAAMAFITGGVFLDALALMLSGVSLLFWAISGSAKQRP
jgi:hypothetical protein